MAILTDDERKEIQSGLAPSETVRESFAEQHLGRLQKAKFDKDQEKELKAIVQASRPLKFRNRRTYRFEFEDGSILQLKARSYPLEGQL